jgi:hypothetical protein
MKALVMSLVILGNVVAATAQSSIHVDTLLPIARIAGARPRCFVVPEYEGYRRPWVFIGARYDTSLVAKEWKIWRFRTEQDTVHDTVSISNYPQRTLLDANGDGHRDFYDTLLVLGTGSGWQPDTLALPANLDKRTVSDLNADGYDDLIMHYQGDSVRIYWGDSALPLRESSLIIKPDPGDSPTWTSNLGIRVIDRLQGAPALLTSYDLDLSGGTDVRVQWQNWNMWKVNATDVEQRVDTIRIDTSWWSFVFARETWIGPIPTLNRGGAWLGMRYGEWISFDTTGQLAREENARDTLVLGSSPIAASLLLPLNHPPTLDSTLVLYVSTGNVLSVSEWLTPADVIPSETRAYYLTPQTIYTTKIEQLVMWPDMTGDSIPELAVRRIPDGRPATVMDYCFEIYDIAGAMVSSVVMPRDNEPDIDVTVRDGRIVWSTAAGDRVSVRVHDATGRLLEAMSAPTSELAATGIDLGNRGRGLRLVELVDGMGHVRRMTVLVQ